MTKWEYFTFQVNSEVDEERMAQIGELGWELVAVDNGTGYFRRPKKNIGPSETKGKEAPSV